MSVADEIEKLNALRQSNAITEEEYQRLKNNLLQPPQSAILGGPLSPADLKMWLLLMHLSLLLTYTLLGVIVPIAMWLIKREESAVIDEHGRNIVNWLISALIMGAVFGILSIVLIGIPFLVCLGIATIIFPIIGAIKASEGVAWKYPCSFKFL